MEPQPAAAGDAPSAAIEALALSPERRLIVRRCLWVLGALGAGSAVGFAFSLYLVNHAPLLLVALSPLGRHVILAVPLVDPFWLIAVVVLRRVVFYFTTFHLGRALGPAGIPWVEARAKRFGGFVRWVERLFNRWRYPVVAVMAGPTVSLLAGISRMHVGAFLALATPGLVLRMVLTVLFAELIREPIEWLLGQIDLYWKPGTAVLVVLVALQQWYSRRRSASPLAPEAGSDPLR